MAALLRERFGLTVTPGGLVQVLHRAARVAAPTYAALCAQNPRQSRREPRREPAGGSARCGTGCGRLRRRRPRCIAFATGVASTRRPRCWAPTLTASWCETGGRRIAASPRRCIRRVWRTWCAERIPSPRIIRAVRGRLACRRSSTDALALRDRREAHAITEHGLAVARGAPARAPRATPRHGARPAGRPALRRPSRPRVSPPCSPSCGRPRVEATNWRAEHAIRPAVVNRKICGGNRTPRGAQTQQVLASVIRTARQRFVDLTELFTTLLRSPRPTVPKALQAPPR